MSEDSPREQRIGPGRLIAVVGPSGAGKDTIIRMAREKLAGEARYVFPQRFITRPSSAYEDNIGMSNDEYERLKADAGFALTWQAHGHSYGLPIAIDAAIRDGHTVICNVSRAIVHDARARYASVLVIEITAPADVLAARLAGRVRASDGDLGARLVRQVADSPEADIVIQNIGRPEDACDAFLDGIASPDAPI